MTKLFRYLKSYVGAIAGVLVLVFLQCLAQLYMPDIMSRIVDEGIAGGAGTNYIIKQGGLMLLVAVGGSVATIGAAFLASRTAAGFCKDVRHDVFEHVEKYTLNEFDQIGTASLVTRTTNDITQMQQFLVMFLRMMLMAPMMAVGGIIMAAGKDGQLTWVLIGIIAVLFIIVMLIAGRTFPLFKSMQKKVDRINLVLREKLTGIRVIRAFNKDEYERKRFDEANTDLTRTAIRIQRIMAAMMPAVMFGMNMLAVVVVWVGGHRVVNMDLGVGDLMAFIQYGMQIMMALMMATMLFVQLPRASAAGSRISEVLGMKPEINDPELPQKPAEDQRGSVEFRDVTFRYPGAEEPTLEHISFRSGPGEVTAIIGGTGSGKSTLLNLILRFYDAESGEILVDGVNVKDMTRQELRDRIAYVPQKAVLFAGTVSENICQGKQDATDEEVHKAASIAQASGFVEEMEGGFEARIEQGGTNVSGGQRQRLSIARALVRKAKINLFDDSFSALDFKTEASLRRDLAKETEDATVIIVGQRVASIMNADHILVLDDGRIAGIGTHQELMQGCEVYREIVASQLSEEEIA
ncbi:ABC transporter ATP-binding protein [Gehongia tenuis]|uniref:ABC transporter ATP-binding protein n=1 Tax=Gehongia tenuis TaxID=2763655 RepID=A0A926D5P0_9FIRM|nr:ABC transporter ATP-binding protein [Gehongia tenuis]